MKKIFPLIMAAMAALLVAALAVITLAPSATSTDSEFFQYDFFMRYNEIRCLRQGTDPFDVWSGKVHVKDFTRIKHNRREPGQEGVHAYPPWEYTMAYPMSLFAPKTAKIMALALNAAFYLALLAWAFRFARKHGKGTAAAWLVVALAFGFNLCVWVSLMGGGNYGGMIATMIVLMAVALEKDDDGRGSPEALGLAGSACASTSPLPFGRFQVFAGLALAFMMVKPHIGLLFCVPLAIGRKFTTLATGAAVCLLASVPPALMCGKSPLEMILQITGSHTGIYWGSALIPPKTHALLMGRFGLEANNVMLLSMALGLLLCVAMSLLLRRSGDWFEKMVPPALIAPMWTYTMEHDMVIWSIPAAWLLVRKTRDWRGWVVAAAALAVGAVACWRSSSDFLSLTAQHWFPILSERFPSSGIFDTVPDFMKMRRKGGGYGYKQVLLVAFFAWAAFQAWRLRGRERGISA